MSWTCCRVVVVWGSGDLLRFGRTTGVDETERCVFLDADWGALAMRFRGVEDVERPEQLERVVAMNQTDGLQSLLGDWAQWPSKRERERESQPPPHPTPPQSTPPTPSSLPAKPECAHIAQSPPRRDDVYLNPQVPKTRFTTSSPLPLRARTHVSARKAKQQQAHNRKRAALPSNPRARAFLPRRPVPPHDALAD